MEASELVPALRSILNPAARVLLMGAPTEAKSGLKWGKSAPVLPRIGAIAGAAGFAIEAAPHYADIAHETPEIVVFDGAAILAPAATISADNANNNGHAAPPVEATAPDLDTVRELAGDAGTGGGHVCGDYFRAHDGRRIEPLASRRRRRVFVRRRVAARSDQPLAGRGAIVPRARRNRRVARANHAQSAH